MSDPAPCRFPPDSEGVPVEAALRAGQERLRAAGVDSSRGDARILLAEVLGVSPGEVMIAGDRRLAASERRDYDAAIARRCRREPVSRILGRREFWSLELAISPATLDPRPDSETLVEAVLDRTPEPDQPRRVLDLGTGSGNLLLAVLAALPGACGLGLDQDRAALACAAANAGALGLSGRALFAASDWGQAVAGGWDIILCNPPYIPTGEIEALAPEVARFEPRGALDGGPDGLSAYRRVAPEIARLLAPWGLAAVELGAGQGDEVAGLARRAGLEVRDSLPDLAGISRCLLLGLRYGPQTALRE